MPRVSTLLVLLAGLLLGAAGTLGAQTTPASLAGTYRYAAQESDNINQAIEAAVARMNFVTRPVARGRLKKTNSAYQTISIAHSPQEVRIVTDQRAPIVTPANGTPIDWTREDGEKFKVSTAWQNGALEQTFRADDGQRVNHYSLSPDGNTLSMRVTVTSPRLSRPLVYTLRYHRAQ